MAPGNLLQISEKTGPDDLVSGTSIAAAFTSGLVAYILSTVSFGFEDNVEHTLVVRRYLQGTAYKRRNSGPKIVYNGMTWREGCGNRKRPPRLGGKVKRDDICCKSHSGSFLIPWVLVPVDGNESGLTR